MDLNRAAAVTDEVLDEIHQQFLYHEWDTWNKKKETKGTNVRDALIHATEVIIANVPPCSDRSTALRKIREARMDCNSAITHNGKY